MCKCICSSQELLWPGAFLLLFIFLTQNQCQATDNIFLGAPTSLPDIVKSSAASWLQGSDNINLEPTLPISQIHAGITPRRLWRAIVNMQTHKNCNTSNEIHMAGTHFYHWSNVNDFTKYHIKLITITQIIKSEFMASLKETKLCSQTSGVSLLTEMQLSALKHGFLFSCAKHILIVMNVETMTQPLVIKYS